MGKLILVYKKNLIYFMFLFFFFISIHEEIRRMSSFEEVFWTVKHMGSLKALGLNGFQATFFQNN